MPTPLLIYIRFILRLLVCLVLLSWIGTAAYAQSGEGVCQNCTVPSLAGTQTASGINLPTYVYTYLKPGEVYSFSGQSYVGLYTPITSYSTDGWRLFAPNGQKTVPTTGVPSYTVGANEGGIWTLIVPQGVAGQWRSFGVSVTSGGATVTGRTYTLLLPIHQSYDNGVDGVDTFTLWYLNVTGGLYRSTFNNYTGWDSNMYADATGMADASKDGYQPLRKSLPRSSPSGSAVGSPNSAIVTNAARPARFNSYDYNSYSPNYYKQFFNQPDATMPATAPIWSLTSSSSTTTWLRPALQTVDLSNLRVSVNGRLLIYNFTVANFNGTAATLRIDQDNNGTTDYTTSIPISSSAVSYTLNTATANIPLSDNLKSTVLIDKGQEIHFILDDVEGFGGLTLVRQNAGSAGTTTSPTIYWDDTSAELDAQNDNPPTQTNGTAGVNSDIAGGVRGWAYNGNSNSSWGNNSYIDSWAFETVSESETVGLVTIAGTVYNDANGLTDNIINGTAPSAGVLYAVLTDATSGTVVSNALVASTGVYNFSAVSAGTYQVRLSSTSATVGSATPAVSLPAGYTTTGEGTAVAGDGTPNGITSVTLTTASSVTGVNFGIEQLPIPTSSTLTVQANPGGTNGVSVPPTSFTGTDADGTITAIRYTTFPTNVTSMTIGATPYTSFPAGGVTAVAGSAVRIDPIDGTVTASIPFRVIDNAGQESTNAGTVSVPFVVLTVSGTVFDDPNGLTDNIINGTATNAGGLFAIISNATTNAVVASTTVASNGTYSFTGLAGGSYQVRLSSTSATVGSAAPVVSLPTGYTSIGEGTATSGDGTPDGITNVTLTTASITGVNFGIEQVPVPTSLTISGQPNPGGTTGVTIAPSSFTGTDADGTITAIRYTTFPTNVTSLTIGNTPYTSFPAGGVTAAVGTNVRIDPADGAVTSVIPFRVIDNAGVESVSSTVGVPFLVVTNFCNSQILFFNEDFGAGTGFGPPLSTVPGYTYTNTDPINDGFYGVVNNPDQGDDFGIPDVWLHGPDHTGNPNGRMLLINGSNPGQIAYSEPVSGLTIGRFYSLRSYITNVLNTSVITGANIKPNLILRVSDNAGTVLASVSTGDIATTSTLTWIPYSMSFTASTTSVRFELVSNASPGTGNDYALDDIQFFEVIQPVLSTTAITSVCPATSASLAGVTASNQPTSTTLTWHSSATATTGNRISDVTALRSGTYYAAFYDGTCYTRTSPFVVLIVPCANPDAGLTISAGVSGTVVANVAANDFANGQPATLGSGGNATIAQTGTYPTGVTLNTTTGSLSVAAGTAPGNYTVTYQLCDRLTPVNCTTATATFTVSPTLSGTVYDDANGLTDNLINGTGTNAGGLYAILTNAASTSVLANALVSNSGAYSFTGLTAGTYSVQLSTTSAVVGTTPPAASVPTGYTVTGEGTAAAGDGSPNGVTSVTLTNTASLTGVNFGLDQIPVPTSVTLASQINPGGLTSVPIPPASFTGTDADGSVTVIRYTAFPSNATSITIGGTTYLLAVLFPAGGVTAVAGTTVRVDPIDGNVTVVIPFRVIDNAGVESTTTGNVSVPFTGLSVSGTIFDDANGLTDNTINGTGTNAGGLFVNLVDASGNVAAFQSVPATGIYSFTGVAASTYSVRLSTTTAAIGSTAPAVSLPTGWTFTGEGTTPAGDGTPNGITSVTVTTASATNVNFGIDQLPVPTSSTLTAQANPGGTNGVSVPPTSFTGTDADGTITAIRYTTFPTNVTSLTIGNTPYTSFPAGGVTAVAGSAVRIDPIDGAVTASIPFRVIDNAGQESTTIGTVSVPFTYVVTAFPDAGTVSSGTGGTAVANVAANDVINGQPATLGAGGNATVAQVGTYPTGVTLNTTTGSLSVAPGTTPGSYTVTYQLCDRIIPATCATSIVSFTITPGISGTVLNDANGLTDNTINGTGTNAGGLFAILVNGANTVVASVSVSPAGVYRFDNIAPAIYSVQLSTTAGTVGNSPPAVSLPANWTSTGEGTTAAGDGVVNGITSVTVGSAEVTGVNFGIEQLPTSLSATLTARANPGGTNAIAIPPSSLTGTDPDGTVVAIRYVSFPTNVTSISINGITYTSANFPPGGITAATGVPVYIDPVDGAGGAVTSVISFRAIDNAGMASATIATVTVPFTCVVPLCPPVTGQKINIR